MSAELAPPTADTRPGSGNGASHMTAEEARRLIDNLCQRPGSGLSAFPLERRIRYARAAAHPDRHGGDRTLWDQVEQARKVLAR